MIRRARVRQTLALALVVSAVFPLRALQVQAAPNKPDPARRADKLKYAIRHIDHGAVDRAIDLAKRPANVKKAERYFVLALAYAQQGRERAAMRAVERALDAGIPVERFLAGPRALAKRLVESRGFRRLREGMDASRLLHGPMLGAMSSTSVDLWLRTAGESSIRVLVREPGLDVATARVAQATTRASRDYTAVLRIDGLKPATDYAYEVYVDGKRVRIDGSASFRSFPNADTPSRFSVAFGGGSNFAPRFEHMWDRIRAKRPAAFLSLGDTTYYDYPDSLASIRYFFYRRQSRPEWRRLTAGVPVFAIWDDHDFAGNDSHGGALPKLPRWKHDIVLRAFRENWANPSFGASPEHPGCWHRFSIGQVDVFMLDGRYYRTRPGRADSTMLGAQQKRWLLEGLASSRAVFKVIASPVPMAQGTKAGVQQSATLGEIDGALDTWDGFAREREEIFDWIAKKRIEGVFLLAADRHRSDAWRIDRPKAYPLYEAMTSHLTKAATHAKAERALFSHVGGPKFGLVHFDTSVEDPTIRYEVVGIDGELVDALVVRRSQLSFDGDD